MNSGIIQTSWFPWLALPALLLTAPAQEIVPAGSPNKTPAEIVLVEPANLTARQVAAWKKEGFVGVAVLLDERFDRPTYAHVAQLVSDASLVLYFWIEVGRNPALAEAHPRWMASLGMHDDWQKKFPNFVLPKEGEVAKAFPWVPIWYQEAYDAHLKRIEQLLKRVPPGYRGLLLNDLQGGPSSCGCGNLQCRWATDYHVPATGARIDGPEAPARFVAAVRERAVGKLVVPVWTTECEDEDLPGSKRPDGKSTGLCGTVGCAVGTCPKDFTKQWSALLSGHEGPIGLLGLHREFDRERPEYGDGPGWLNHAVAYLDQVPPQNGGKAMGHDRLWLVVQGYDTKHEPAARRLAATLGASTVIVARTKLDQSFEPRLVQVKQP